MKSNRLFVILAALAVVLLGVFALMGPWAVPEFRPNQ